MSTNQASCCSFHKVSQSILLLILVLVPSERIHSLRTGAPGLACLTLRPFHGLHRSRPGSASQFFITQSSLTYGPNQNVSIDIATLSSERYFRGFMVQAYNPATGYQVGRFLPTSESKPLDCSASTHRNNLNKKYVTLIWVPGSPNNPGEDTPGDTLNLADQWLGMRNALRGNSQPALAPSNGNPVAGVSSTISTPASVTNRKRQLSFNVGSNTYPRQPIAINGVHQVRFRATIVVTYDEFYNGFESSDQKFDKIEHGTGTIGFPNNNSSSSSSPSTVPATITVTD